MFCEEKIIAVHLGKPEYGRIEGENYWFDCYHSLTLHTTSGYRLVLETENWMLSLGVEGVVKCRKEDFRPYDGEWLEEKFHREEPFEEAKAVLFDGERLVSVEQIAKGFLLTFDDFVLKLIPYELGTMNVSLQSKDPWSYHRVLGFARYLRGRCPHCGGEGEVLLDFVRDYVVRCKACRHSTYAEMELRPVLEAWNRGEVPCDLSDITIE